MFAAANSAMFTQAFYQEPIQMACYYPDEPDSFDSVASFHRRSSLTEVNPFEDSFSSFLNSSRATTPSSSEGSSNLGPCRRPSAAGSRSNSERADTLLKNRRAAAKCRQRKKEWLTDMSRSVQRTEYENTRLQAQVADLKEEIINIRMVLASHSCPLDYLTL
ncbi:hypothetical protein DSO57_1028610 [Entomophthora muscae]|uniref:Uncharacterized protein n=1 Tax=Entomophthora muscae TaxID=34485 RepID=A0ACC2T1H8_9FUNG|nr:hypothetical protein DSO57_1028610 [Entomophthora muscae]